MAFFLEGLQNYMENRSKGHEKKRILGDFNWAMGKWTRMVEIKSKDFTDAIPIVSYQNSERIMGLRIYGERRTQIPLSSPATIDSLAQDPG